MARDARLLAGVAVVLCVAVGAATSASGQAVPGDAFVVEHWNGAAWKVAHVVPPRGGGKLRAVTAISPTDLWAVGSAVRTSRPFAEHYNGTYWSPVVLPARSRGSQPGLNAVSADSANDVWAVGSIGPHTHTLIEHFNGKAWKVVPSPSTRGWTLRGVAAVTRRNAWAVGSLAVKTKNSRPLIEHWKGSSWRRVSSPNPPGPEDELLAISARSARDIWAVGDYRSRGATRPLVLHWNGRRWKQVASHGPPLGGALWGVTAIGAKDAWAVGQGATRPLAEHWNGRAWDVVSVRAPAGSTAPFLAAVSASSPSDVWAAGQDGYEPHAKALVEHWDGRAWTSFPTRTVGDEILTGIAAVSRSNVWAVGERLLESLR
jgi:hypothetical protein